MNGKIPLYKVAALRSSDVHDQQEVWSVYVSDNSTTTDGSFFWYASSGVIRLQLDGTAYVSTGRDDRVLTKLEGMTEWFATRGEALTRCVEIQLERKARLMDGVFTIMEKAAQQVEEDSGEIVHVSEVSEEVSA